MVMGTITYFGLEFLIVSVEGALKNAGGTQSEEVHFNLEGFKELKLQ